MCIRDRLDIVIPYGIAIHPRNGDIYVTDAKNYVSSGVLPCYSREGVHKWSVRTGDIPAHMAVSYTHLIARITALLDAAAAAMAIAAMERRRRMEAVSYTHLRNAERYD